LEIGLLHQPVCEAAQQIGVGTTTLITASPQPDVIGEQESHAALTALAENEQRLVLGALHQHLSLARLGIDHSEPPAPGRLLAGCSRKVARDRVFGPEIGQSRPEWLLHDAA